MTAAESWQRTLAAIIERTATGPAPRAGGRCLMCGSLVGASDVCSMSLEFFGEELTHEEARVRAIEMHRKGPPDPLDNGRDPC